MKNADFFDQQLASTVRQTLDAAVREPDPEVDAALAKMRQRLRTQENKRRTPLWEWAGGVALAASVAAVVILPRLLAPEPGASVVELASVPTEDLQFLEDMDMLKTLDTL